MILVHYQLKYLWTIYIIRGDIAYNKGINEYNCIHCVEKIVNEHKKKNYLLSSDYIAVVHIIDTDGAFMNKINIVENALLSSNKFEKDKLFTNNRTFMIDRFERKKIIYTKLYETNIISGIKYYKFYFSRNLEHALYGIENATVEEKIKLSNSFDKTYNSDAKKFEKKMKDMMNEIPNDYNESWNYIFSDNNSIKKCSNISIIFDLIKQIIYDN